MQAYPHSKIKKQEDLKWNPICELISCVFTVPTFLPWLLSVLTTCRINTLFFVRQIKFREDISCFTLQLKHHIPSPPNPAKSHWDLCDENSYSHGGCVWSLPGAQRSGEPWGGQ